MYTHTLPSSLRYDIYKYTHGLHCVSNTLSKVDIEPITKGHKYKLKKLRCCTSVRQHFVSTFTESRIYNWNTLLPEVVDSILSLPAFKRLFWARWEEEEERKKKKKKKKKKKNHWVLVSLVSHTVTSVLKVSLEYIAYNLPNSGQANNNSAEKRGVTLSHFSSFLTVSLVFNPFTASACTVSGLKDAGRCLQTVYFPVL